VDAASAQADLLWGLGFHDQAQSVLAKWVKDIEPFANDRWNRDQAVVLAHARLVAEWARMMTRAEHTDEAIRVLAEEYARCETPLNRRALSTLRTMLAWTLRAVGDVDGVINAGKEAFELALAEDAPWEIARALIVLGSTLLDLGETADAASALRKAAEVLPARYHEDAWLIRLRLSDLFEATDRYADARAMLQEAVQLAEEGSLGAWAEWTRERLSSLPSPEGIVTLTR
jgi:tetratricopeptide (TPR) repeat protein